MTNRDREQKERKQSDEETAAILARLREAHAKNSEAVESEFRRKCDSLKGEEGNAPGSWREMVRAENEVVPDLGCRDENHKEEKATKQRKKKPPPEGGGDL